ncbi:hypothetical protein [Nannocystis pusilla]|nr:hypothetical protein [Nannocystis pusilla]
MSDSAVHGDKRREALNFGRNADARPVQRACDGLAPRARDLRL